MKEFRVLNITDTTISFTNQRVIVVELVEIIYFGPTLSTGQRLYRFGAEGQFFIFDYYTNIAKSIMTSAQHEDLVELDIDDFKMVNELKRGRHVDSYYHNSVTIF